MLLLLVHHRGTIVPDKLGVHLLEGLLLLLLGHWGMRHEVEVPGSSGGRGESSDAPSGCGGGKATKASAHVHLP